MNNRITVQGTTVFIRLLHGPKGEGQVGFLMKWYEGLDFAEDLVEACDQARRNAERENIVPHDRKNQ